MATVKCVVLGDKGCGKTTFFQSYVALSKGKDLAGLTTADKTEVPESSSNYAVMKLVEDNMYFLSLFNTSGQEDNDAAMKVFYAGTSVFVVCFSVTNKDSLGSVKDKWLPAIKADCPDAPFVLVGTKIDLRDDGSVTKEEGTAAAEEMGAVVYMECSATTQEGVDAIFDKALDAGKSRAEADTAGIGIGDTGAPAAAAAAVTEPVKPQGPRATKKDLLKEEEDKAQAEIPKAETLKAETEAPIQPEPKESEPVAESETKEEKKEEEKKKDEKQDKKEKKKGKKGCTIL